MAPASTISNAAATNAIYNHLGRPLRAGGGAAAPVVLDESARGGCDIWPVGVCHSAGACPAGIDPVGVIGKTGVEDGITGGGGRARESITRSPESLPATTGGTDDAFDSDCCDS